ncbi:MAG: metalloregulator ArsR/SmtB family transcription factor [Roseibium sp.]|uniref:ArsR/SmtB family transcription factor n=1 Tax=Roseibium sp. TaxID=1936156 RepID=UPI0026199899|nr:metalloregulator ArsR/SmtB family transcription factor [Roseibium sp.]MCV0427010.1 metalloregulator ArsR/SmtB family transcription factor [Roseibium sp.]
MMQEMSPDLIRTFAALSDPVRMATIARLAEGPAAVGELAEPFSLSPAGFSKHLQVLQAAGLVTKKLDGRRHICSLQPEPLKAAYDWLGFYQNFWSGTLDHLEAFLESDQGNQDSDKKTGL